MRNGFATVHDVYEQRGKRTTLAPASYRSYIKITQTGDFFIRVGKFAGANGTHGCIFSRVRARDTLQSSIGPDIFASSGETRGSLKTFSR